MIPFPRPSSPKPAADPAETARLAKARQELARSAAAERTLADIVCDVLLVGIVAAVVMANTAMTLSAFGVLTF